ncbi:ATP-dependent DNA ligase [Streptomyces mirabilis]|uniref:ATP-dependent DNA ligase n=1 Tax=Streptomyces mirabilis TaxID=68239 RepID=UPI0036EBC898
MSFETAQARAASSPTRAHRLTTQHPAHYLAFDALQLPSGDARSRPYTERRTALLNLLPGMPANTPIQAVSATTDRDTALTWYTTLHNQGIEGIIAKRTTSPYRAGHTGAWLKIRHADTIEATVAGFTGTARRPRALAVRLPDGRVTLSQRLTTVLATQIAPRLVPHSWRAYAQGGDACTPVSGQVVVEVAAGTTRHAVVTVVRLRRPDHRLLLDCTFSPAVAWRRHLMAGTGLRAVSEQRCWRCTSSSRLLRCSVRSDGRVHGLFAAGSETGQRGNTPPRQPAPTWAKGRGRTQSGPVSTRGRGHWPAPTTRCGDAPEEEPLDSLTC